jgi:hypothetical protein
MYIYYPLYSFLMHFIRLSRESTFFVPRALTQSRLLSSYRLTPHLDLVFIIYVYHIDNNTGSPLHIKPSLRLCPHPLKLGACGSSD